MKKGNKKKASSSFLLWLASIDYDKVYSLRVRIVCHALMWLIFTFSYYIYLRFGYGFSGLSKGTAFIFSTTRLLSNLIVFYCFFYLIVPQILTKKRALLIILAAPVCVALWLVIHHLVMTLLVYLHFNANDSGVQKSISINAKYNFWNIINPEVIGTYFPAVVGAVSPYFFVKFTFDIARFYSHLLKQEKKVSQLQLENLNLERDFLKAQLNPHFLFNTFNTLYGMVRQKDPHAEQMISQLSDIMRYTLYQSNAPKVSLEKELDFLRNYVSLEKMRYDKDSHIDCSLNDTEVNGQMIAPLLTFVFVENAFKYGLKSMNGGFLKLSAGFFDNIFYFTVINDKELQPKSEKQDAGIGIQNIRKRLESLYEGKYDLKIENREDSFYVEMKINLKDE